jgi:tetratricopeptide (TPR) repeat protein
MIYLSYILSASILVLFSSCSAPDIPRDALERYLEGKKLYIQGDLDTSSELFLAVHRQVPRFSQNSFMLGKAYFFRRDYKGAEEIWRETLDRNPGHTDSRKWLARLWLQQGEAQVAAELVSIALENNSEDPELLILLAKAKAADGDYAAAIQLYQRVQFFEQRLAEARIDLAEIYQRFGLNEKALPELEQAGKLIGETSPLYTALQSLLAALRGEDP